MGRSFVWLQSLRKRAILGRPIGVEGRERAGEYLGCPGIIGPSHHADRLIRKVPDVWIGSGDGGIVPVVDGPVVDPNDLLPGQDQSRYVV